MLYLLYGPNSYLRRKKITQLVETKRAQHPTLRVERFFVDEEGEANRLHEFVVSRDLFGSLYKLAVVDGSAHAQDKSTLMHVLGVAEKDRNIILILNEETRQKSIPVTVADLLKKLEVQEQYFSETLRDKMPSLVFAECKERGIAVEASAVRALCALYGSDTEGVMNEIQKLSFLDEPVSLDLLRRLGGYAQDLVLFEFSRIIFGRTGVRERLGAWERLQLQHTEPHRVFNYCAKVATQRDDVEKIARADISIKSGRLESEQAMLALVLG